MATEKDDFNEKSVTYIEQLMNVLEKDSRGFEIITYGLTSVGLLTALYRIRPFAKFSNPQKVPSHFIKNQTVLRGTVARIEPGKVPLILVDHKPLIRIPRFGESKYLPVKIAAVDVNNHGVSWLSTIVQGNEVEFMPVKKANEFLHCTVTMSQQNQEPLKIGKELVRLGFGTVGELSSDPKNSDLLSYKKTLVSAQKWAQFKRNGQWHFTIPPTVWWRVKNIIYDRLSIRSS
ncbi:hypothetical protein PV327_000644 [Microctonus hyperodae]|uniref:Uncharacterized protein n=1 Tax=Microctonus hyperodae TaxID=165561 RepID=A0AA39G704_MICHY|nr:hypothetical protein PV327_000644 [Microctonus hyperodae]